MKLKSAIITACFAPATSAAAHTPRETVTPNFEHAIPNIQGKSLKAVIVDYSPGGASPAYSHAKSAVIYGYVASGVIETQVEGEPRRAVCVGVSADEFPGVRPVISGNASAKGPMGLLTVFVTDTDNRALTTPNN